MLFNLWRSQTWDVVLDKQPRQRELREKYYWKYPVAMILAFKMSIISLCFKIYNNISARQWNSDQWRTGRIWVRNSWDVQLYAILIGTFLSFRYASERPWRKTTRADLFLLNENKGEKGVLIRVCFSESQMVLVLCCPSVEMLIWLSHMGFCSGFKYGLFRSDMCCTKFLLPVSGPWHTRLSCDNNIFSGTSALPCYPTKASKTTC